MRQQTLQRWLVTLVAPILVQSGTPQANAQEVPTFSAVRVEHPDPDRFAVVSVAEDLTTLTSARSRLTRRLDVVRGDVILFSINWPDEARLCAAAKFLKAKDGYRTLLNCSFRNSSPGRTTNRLFLVTNDKSQEILPESGASVLGVDMNENGQIAGMIGQRPFVLRDGELHLPDVPGSSRARALSSDGRLAGSAYDLFANFIDSPGSATIEFQAGVDPYVHDINSSGLTVGQELFADNHLQAALWQDGSATNLGSMIEEMIGERPIDSNARAINDSGAVVGDYYSYNQGGGFLMVKGQMYELSRIITNPGLNLDIYYVGDILENGNITVSASGSTWVLIPNN